MNRLHDWPQRLSAYLFARRETPFEWGRHDCCKFSAGAVEAMTGVDPSAPWPYSNEIGARRLMLKHDGVAGLVTAALGEPCHPSAAGRGDIVLAYLDHGPTAGVCLSQMCAFAEEPAGIAMLPRTVIRIAWKV